MKIQRGVSLFEFLIVLVLTGIGLSAALPYWHDWQQVSIARQWSQQMQLSLAMMRQQALRETQDLTLCGSVNLHDCQSDITGAWLLFQDNNGDGQRQANEVAAIWQPSVPEGWTVVWRSFRNQPQLVWMANGDAAFSNGTLTLCPRRAQDSALRQLVLSKSGRVRLVNPLHAGTSTLSSARKACGWSP